MIEKEIKYILTKEDFKKIILYLDFNKNIKQKIIQYNFYFDSINFNLKKEKESLRIRIFSNKKAELTLKKKVKTKKIFIEAKIRDEKTIPIKFEEGKEILKKGNINSYLNFFLNINYSFEIKLLGGLKTYRNTYNLFEGDLCLDKNIYFNCCDYELEWEGENFTEARDKINLLFCKLDIKPLKNNLSKSSRFISRYKKGEI